MRAFEPVLPVEAITPEWMTTILSRAGRLGDAVVVDVQHEPCGTGQLADSYRLRLSYDVPGSGPATLVGKFASKDATSRAFGQQSGYYRSEIGFYRELASGLGMSIPVPVHAALADNETDFVLLMEDLAPARRVDQLDGCSAAESALVLEQAAVLHARSWRSADLAAREWLKGPVSAFTQVTDQFADVLRRFSELSADLVSASDLREAARLVEYAGPWKRVFSDPQCLWHSDLRADNVLFEVGGGARPVAVLDWQGVGFGRGSIDVAYWLGTSMRTEERRVHERELVRRYHAALQRNGVDYGFERCWQDYRAHALHGLQVGVFGLGAVKRTPRGDQMWKCWIERTAAQVRDLESYEALRDCC
jgi:aminoglycoside phosphotransferase (APT) family kinase protein